MQWVTVLGATGSIGVNTLDVIRTHPDRYGVFAITAHHQIELLIEQCVEFKPLFAVIKDESSAQILKANLIEQNVATEVLYGVEALETVAAHSQVDIVMAAIVGAAGLVPTLAAVKAGKKVLLANKEALVMSGRLFMDAAKASGATILPTDSEHNAIFQCLPETFQGLEKAGISRLLLTGSGGPFRTTPVDQLTTVTPDQACAHPNWSMGRKISVDSATMMNKGLEFIEACWLFHVDPDDIDIVVHPQSVVHSMVEYVDGSVVAQMGQPDMRTPIAHCLGWPDRIESNAEKLDFTQLSSLTFEAPDFGRFPCLKMAIDAVRMGGTFPVALNAANEIAVEYFLDERIGFMDIPKVIRNTLDNWQSQEPTSISDVLAADEKSRSFAKTWCESIVGAQSR